MEDNRIDSHARKVAWQGDEASKTPRLSNEMKVKLHIELVNI